MEQQPHYQQTSSQQPESNVIIEEQIKLALVNSLSLNDQLRTQSLEFLTTQCEPNPELQKALLNIIAKNHFIAGTTSQEDASMLQYQAIMFMKNSLNRLFQAHRNKKLFKQNGPQLTDVLKESIKQQLLSLIQAPDGIIHTEKSYEQLTLVAAILVHYDFPANWPELNQWLLSTFNQLYSSLGTLSIEQVPHIKRFLKFYLEVMGAQNKKKLNPSKGQFHKVARDHLKAIYQVWVFFNQQQTQMLYDQASSTLTLEKFNQDLFELASKLDKCLQLVIACGFSLHDLLGEPKNNQFVRTTQQLIEKIQYFTTCVDKLSQLPPGTQGVQKFYDLFQKQIKALLKLITDLQYAEPLIVFDSLGLYIETLAQILFKGQLHNEKVKKLALFALYRVINVDVYNSNNADKQGFSDGIGILVSPSKFKNFEPQVSEAKSQYQFILDKPDPTSKDPRAINRKDGAREILKLVFQFYLPIGDNINSWQTDPESFIELEDENYFISEFDLDSACSVNFLAHQLTERLITQLYYTCYSFIKDDLLIQYFNGSLPLQNEFIEDALMAIVGMLAKIQQKLPADKRLDIEYVLAFIQQNKFTNPLFKRRYTHLLTQWVKIIPKSKLMDYFRFIVQSLQEVTDHVLIYEHCRCIHELIKEIDYWIKKKESGNRATYAQGSLFEHHGTSPISEEEDQIQMSVQINREIDYTQLFSLVASKTIPILGVFQAPTLVWNMINYLTLLLEKNSDSQSLMTECFKALNLQHLLLLDQKLIDEAILDMLKNLFALQPSSSVILEMCIAVLDFKLAKKPDAMVISFWLFTTRAVTSDNQSIGNLKQLFSKYSWYADLKKDYMVAEFLRIVQEYVMIGIFTTQEELVSLIQYMHQKFIQEVQIEAQWALKNQEEGSADNDGSSDDVNESNIYEKKLNIIVIIHLILQKAQSNLPDVLNFALVSIKDFLISVCSYFVDFKVQKNLPNSSIFYTQAITLVNRIIAVNREYFIHSVLEPMCSQKGIVFGQFIESWFNKMELIVSQECRRINLLAIYNILPFFSGELLQKTIGEIGRLTFTILESHMHLKLLVNETRYCSPSKISHYHVISTKVKINMMEKISQRIEQLKREDSLLDLDIIDFFWRCLQETQKSLDIQPNLEVLSQFIQDAHMRLIYTNLLSQLSGNNTGVSFNQQSLGEMQNVINM